MKNNNNAVVVFSGGQDSTTCLFWALQRFDKVHCITFDYGQKHSQEIIQAQKIVATINADFVWNISSHYIFNAKAINELCASALTRNNIAVPEYDDKNKDQLPATFVPGRNIAFLTYAAMYAYQVKAANIVTGVCETDFSGYPDCRNNFINAMQLSLSLGFDQQLQICTPLMWLTKAQTWQLAASYGSDVLELIQNLTLTCYNGIIGSGCGNCASCHLRNHGLQQANLA